MSNIIITNLSRLGNKTRVYNYKTFDKNDDTKISGVNTNDAPVKSLVRHINAKGETVGKILTVTTKEAAEAYVQFCSTLQDYSYELSCTIPLPKKIAADESRMPETIRDIISEISPDDKVYIDTTGSFRNASYLLMSIVRILEFSDIKLEMAVYSNFEKKEIEDVTYLYSMFDLINAVNIFTSMGNSSELNRYFKKYDNSVLRDTISVMNEFSEELTICRTSKLAGLLEKLNDCLDRLSKEKNNDRDMILFKSLTDTIKKKFRFTDGKLEYPAVVRWCLDNNLLQQAVTVYVEKMPEYLFKNGYFTATQAAMESAAAHAGRNGGYKDVYSVMLYEELMRKVPKPEEPKLFDSFVRDENAVRELYTDGRNDLSSFLSSCPHFSGIEMGGYVDKLELILGITDEFYPGGQRCRFDTAELTGKFSDMPHIRNVIAELNRNDKPIPATPEKFIRSFLNNKTILNSIITGIAHEADDHLTFIELVKAEQEFDGEYTVGNRLSDEELKKLLRDIFYLKKFVRNSLAHAQDSDNQKSCDSLKNLIPYYNAHGYITSDELSAEYIREILNSALELFSS